MAWLNDLYQTYQNNLGQVAQNLNSGVVLLPIAHSTQNATVEISIDDNGNCLWANRLPKSESVTIIPVTEDSASRSSGISPHPLEDKLIYIAGDYEAYTGYDNSKEFQAYLCLLNNWCNHPTVPEEVLAIQKYVSGRHLMHDLVEKGCLSLIDGRLEDSSHEGIKQADFFVRFSVHLLKENIFEEQSAVYRNVSIFHAYEQYYIESLGERGTDLCYATGERMACSEKHPSKIRNTGDKAKLISANDTSGFTFRGRFFESEQVASVGYEVSQKAHNALRWLIAKQGIYNVGQMIVPWEIGGKQLPDIFGGTLSLFTDDDIITDTTNESYANRVGKAVKGYKEVLDTNAEVVVLSVDAATVGRLSIVYYKKMKGSEFIQNLLHWYETCNWKLSAKNILGGFVGTPSLDNITFASYGKNSDALIKSAKERLLPCIVDRRLIPRDIVESALYRISNRTAFETKSEFFYCLSIVCAMVRKYRYDMSVKNKYVKKEEWDVAVDETCKDRSYLFGRWLAAAQRVEEATFGNEDKDRGRITAAERYMQQFSKKPMETTKIISECLSPYIEKVKGTKNYWKVSKMYEIMDLMQVNQYIKREPLSELYILGYSSQMNSYFNKKSEESKTDNVYDESVINN